MAFQVMIICPDHSLKTDMAQLVKEERKIVLYFN